MESDAQNERRDDNITDYRAEKENAEDAVGKKKKKSKKERREKLKESVPTEIIKAPSRKERYTNGIEAACTIIVEVMSRTSKITQEQQDTVLASLLCGEVISPKTDRGKKALRKVSKTDRDFVYMAMITCRKTKFLGGERDEMECATASILACRGLKKYSRFTFDLPTMQKISDNIAQETLLLKEFVDTEDETNSDIRDVGEDRSFGTSSRANRANAMNEKYVSNISSTIDYCVFDDVSFEEVTVNSLGSIESIREKSINTWNENMCDYVVYGIAEILHLNAQKLFNSADEWRGKKKKGLEDIYYGSSFES